MSSLPETTAAMSEQQHRSVIVVACPAEISQKDALCRAMVQSLSRAAPDRVIRRIPSLEEQSLRAGDLGVVLHVDAIGQDRLSGHLEWQQGTSSARHTGPVVQLDVMDTGLRPSMFDQFTDGLVKASPDLLKPGSR